MTSSDANTWHGTLVALGVLIVFLAIATAEGLQAEELIAFTRTDSEGYWQIWLMAPDGGEPRQVTHSRTDKREPAWIEGGQRLAYRTNNGRLFLVGRDGTGDQELLTRYRNIADPQYSPATGEIVFVRYDPTTIDVSDIWKTDLPGERPALLTRGGGLKYQPAVTSDGEQIAFVRAEADDPTSSHHLWLMDGDGSGTRALTSTPGLYSSPAFSPDGKRIAFSSNFADDDYEVYVLDLGSAAIDRLTHNAGLDASPSFSPDGNRVAFVSNRSGSQQIWVVSATGNGLMQLTDGTAESLEPTWVRIDAADEELGR